ncbi:hypothetical protein [Cohnella lubricantis]|nr:hypothetical protein [Cohnella lubricantis]
MPAGPPSGRVMLLYVCAFVCCGNVSHPARSETIADGIMRQMGI